MNKYSGLMVVSVFAVGIAVGWFSRGATGKDQPVGEETQSKPSVISATTPAANDDSAAPPVVGKRAIRDVSPKKPDDAVARIAKPGSEEMKSLQNQALKMMATQQRKKVQQRIDKLSTALALTDAQKAGLKTWLDERISKMESMSIEDADEMEGDEGLMSSFTDQALEKQLAASLTEAQRTALAEFNERDTQTKTDSAALKSLSQLQGVIDFEEGQRDAVYKIFSDAAAAKIQKENESPASSALDVGGFGFDLDPYDLGIEEIIKEATKEATTVTSASGETPARENMGENFRTLIDQRIEAKVDLLRPVLNDRQLEQYRTELKNKGSGMLGGMMMGIEAPKGGATSIVIPAD